MDNEYQSAFFKPSTLFLLRFKKKLTVTGISGNTQGVITASKPVAKQSKKILHIEPVFFVSVAALASTVLFAPAPTSEIDTFIFSSPLGNSSPFVPNQLKEPLILVVPALQ